MKSSNFYHSVFLTGNYSYHNFFSWFLSQWYEKEHSQMVQSFITTFCIPELKSIESFKIIDRLYFISRVPIIEIIINNSHVIVIYCNIRNSNYFSSLEIDKIERFLDNESVQKCYANKQVYKILINLDFVPENIIQDFVNQGFYRIHISKLRSFLDEYKKVELIRELSTYLKTIHDAVENEMPLNEFWKSKFAIAHFYNSIITCFKEFKSSWYFIHNGYELIVNAKQTTFGVFKLKIKIISQEAARYIRFKDVPIIEIFIDTENSQLSSNTLKKLYANIEYFAKTKQIECKKPNKFRKQKHQIVCYFPIDYEKFETQQDLLFTLTHVLYDYNMILNIFTAQNLKTDE